MKARSPELTYLNNLQIWYLQIIIITKSEG